MKYRIEMIFMVVALFMTGSLFGQGFKIVEVDGVAVIEEDNIAKARESAITDALRKAVEQTVSSYVPSQGMVENYQLINEKIYSKTTEYIKTYKIISERTDEGLFTIRVEAEIAQELIRNDLSSIGLMIARKEVPRLLLMIAEQGIYDNSYAYWWGGGSEERIFQNEELIAEKLKDKGFIIIERTVLLEKIPAGDSGWGHELKKESIIKAGSISGADIVIYGKAHLSKGEDVEGSTLKSCYARLYVEAMHAGSGKLIVSMTENAAGIFTDENIAATNALKKATDALTEKLAKKILAYWNDEVINSRRILIEFKNPSNFQEIKTFQEEVKKLKNVQDTKIKMFTPEFVGIEVRIAGIDTDTIAERIVNSLKGRIELRIDKVSSDKIVIKKESLN